MDELRMLGGCWYPRIKSFSHEACSCGGRLVSWLSDPEVGVLVHRPPPLYMQCPFGVCTQGRGAPQKGSCTSHTMKLRHLGPFFLFVSLLSMKTI